ncbi:hypothetical protein MN116_007702 [Schistosoma mekongi]|uniref:ubiquitinyl hydrolase 1 n=1 Tax=Schistosoma mekongi TaxID=38744 RepID=A0AAE1Z6J0_SCHME|nr:hypothetical protein MN116_007702 [Schistosoma mekongi]
MSRFSQLTASSDLHKQFCGLKLNSKLQPVSGNRCSNPTTKSNKRKTCTPNCSTESLVRPHLPNFALKNDVHEITHEGLYIEPCGLRNVRNSCFLNVSLQLLLNIPTLCSTLYKSGGLRVSLHSEPVRHTLDAQEKKAFLTDQLLELIEKLNPHVEYKATVNNYFTSHHNDSNADIGTNKRKVLGNLSSCPVSPNYKLPHSNGIQPYALHHLLTPNPVFGQLLNMNTGFQEDAAECLTYLLTQLHEEMGRTIAMSSDVHQNEADCDQNDSEWVVTGRAGKHYPEAKKIELEGGQSPISSLFCGTLVTRSHLSKTDNNNYSVLMNTCSRKSAIKEPFFILPVPIDNPAVNSVESALRCLGEPEEIISHHNSSNSRISSVYRRSTIDHLPPYLIIQLKRFYDESKSNNLQNINGSVNSFSSVIIRKHLKSVNIQLKFIIPKELLNQEIHFSNSQRHYHLHSVIFHVGETVESGHYTIAVRINNHHQKLNDTLTFLYFDDDRACMLNSAKSINLLLTTHRPLDTRSCTFLHLTKKHHETELSRSSSSQHSPVSSSNNHPRTPYILVYESQLVTTHSDE